MSCRISIGGAIAGLLFASQVYAGSGAANGGSRVGLEFTQAALRAVTLLVEKNEGLPPELKTLDPKAISDAIQTTRLTVKKSLCQVDPNTGPQDCLVARNYPDEKLIEISESDWTTLASNPKLQVAIALHEYLGILRIESNVYYLSARLNAWLNEEPIENRLAFLQTGSHFRYSTNDSGMGVEMLDGKFKKVYVGLRYQGRSWTTVFTCESILAQDCRAPGGPSFHGASLTVLPGGSQIYVVLGKPGDTEPMLMSRSDW